MLKMFTKEPTPLTPTQTITEILPYEVLLQIVALLDPLSIAKLTRVNTKFYAACSDEIMAYASRFAKLQRGIMSGLDKLNSIFVDRPVLFGWLPGTWKNTGGMGEIVINLKAVIKEVCEKKNSAAADDYLASNYVSQYLRGPGRDLLMFSSIGSTQSIYMTSQIKKLLTHPSLSTDNEVSVAIRLLLCLRFHLCHTVVKNDAENKRFQNVLKEMIDKTISHLTPEQLQQCENGLEVGVKNLASHYSLLIFRSELRGLLRKIEAHRQGKEFLTAQQEEGKVVKAPGAH